MSVALCNNIDIELFIQEIKKYPEIWNLRSEVFHDKVKKRLAWISTCRTVIPEFDEKTDNDRNEICNVLIKKWRNIKDCYLKSTKKKFRSGSYAAKSGGYIYSKQLSFLTQASVAPETESILCSPKQELEGNVADGEDESSEALSTRTEIINGKRKRDLEAWPTIDFNNTSDVAPQIFSEPNPDRLFFESIIPMLAEFTENEKLEFRLEVLTILKRMKATQQNSTYAPTDSPQAAQHFLYSP